MAVGQPRSQPKPPGPLSLVESDAADTSAHGRRYSPQQKEAAYSVWKAVARSMAKTAAATGISRNTLTDWHRHGEWSSRADQEDRETGDAFRDIHWKILGDQVLPNILTAIEIRDNTDASNKDRLNAVQWLSGIVGFKEAEKQVERPQPTTDNRYGGRPLHELTDEELLALEGL